MMVPKKPAKKAAKKKPVAVRKTVPKQPPDEIRDHGDIVTAPSHFSEGQIAAKLAGVENVPSLEELGKAKAPPWDPHAGHEVAPGREFGGEPEAMISTLVFIGVDHGGDFEDSVQSLVALAETLGFKYVTATIGHLDLGAHFDNLADIDGETTVVVDDDDQDEEKPERFDEEPI
jgi:hypothetical protein